jgi:hypothetical protein
MARATPHDNAMQTSTATGEDETMEQTHRPARTAGASTYTIDAADLATGGLSDDRELAPMEARRHLRTRGRHTRDRRAVAAQHRDAGRHIARALAGR